MLTALQLEQHRPRRPLPSLKQLYHEYILQRIEDYKNGLRRNELLNLANEAFAEMGAAQDAQFVLTEVVMADCVDRLISRRLRLPSYRRWVAQFKELRAAQREPTHWGIDRRCPLQLLLPRLEPGDCAMVIGADAAPLAFLLSAHEVSVLYMGCDMTFVDQVESRVAEEGLSEWCITYVAPAGYWPGEVLARAHIVVVDTGTLDMLSARQRRDLFHILQDHTEPGGAHLILPSDRALAPEAFLSFYQGWHRDGPASEKRRQARPASLLVGKPAANEGTAHSASTKSADRTA
jgi:hypothetical protein